MERRTTEKKYYVVYELDKSLLWTAHTIVGKTPVGWETKAIQGFLPPMTARQLCDYFGVEYSTIYPDRSHLQTRINRALKAIAFHSGEYKENRVVLRLAIDTRLCSHCKRPVCKSLVDGCPFECLHCDENLMNFETIRADKNES